MDPSVNHRRKIFLHNVFRPQTAGPISLLQRESSKTGVRIRPWTAEPKMRSAMSTKTVTRRLKSQIKSPQKHDYVDLNGDNDTSSDGSNATNDEGETKQRTLSGSDSSALNDLVEGQTQHSDEYDTDIEDERKPGILKKMDFKPDLSGIILYEAQCKKHGCVPISFLKRNLDKRNVRMRHHYLGGFDTRPVAAALQRNTVTENLDLSDNCVEDIGACYIANMLKENMFIASLNLSNNFIRSSGAAAFASMLQENTTLKSLTLSSNQLQDRDAFHFIEALKNNMSLMSLDLSNNNFGERGGEFLGAALTVNETLTDLDISWNGIRLKGAVAIAKALKVNGSLEMLDLAWNGFGLQGAIALQQTLQVNTTLKVLDLTNNRFHNEAGKKLAIGLKKNFGLVTLLLDMNPLRDDGVEAILKAVAVHKTLKFLSLEEMSINTKNFQTIKEIEDEKSIIILHGGIGGYQRNSALTSVLHMLVMFVHEHRGHLEDVFNQQDKERRGHLTQDEMATCLKSAGLRLTSRQLDMLVTQLDCSHTGSIKYSDLLSGKMFHDCHKYRSRSSNSLPKTPSSMIKNNGNI